MDSPVVPIHMWDVYNYVWATLNLIVALPVQLVLVLAVSAQAEAPSAVLEFAMTADADDECLWEAAAVCCISGVVHCQHQFK